MMCQRTSLAKMRLLILGRPSAMDIQSAAVREDNDGNYCIIAKLICNVPTPALAEVRYCTSTYSLPLPTQFDEDTEENWLLGHMNDHCYDVLPTITCNTECRKQGLKKIAGSLAHKLCAEFPDLGSTAHRLYTPPLQFNSGSFAFPREA